MGLAVGISSGAIFVGPVRRIEEDQPGATVVTIFSDCTERYLSTNLFLLEPVDEKNRTPGIKIDRWVSVPCPEEV